MAINRTIYTPLTLVSGSISVPSKQLTTDGNLILIPSSALEPHSQSLTSAGVWNHIVKTSPQYTTGSLSGAIRINDMTVNFDNNFNYLVIGNFGVSTSDAAAGARIGMVFSGTVYSASVYEVPSSKIAISYGNNTPAATTTSPSSDIDNYYMAKVVVMALVNSANASVTPTLSLNAAAANRTASIGPSIISYMKY